MSVQWVETLGFSLKYVTLVLVIFDNIFRISMNLYVTLQESYRLVCVLLFSLISFQENAPMKMLYPV